MNLLAAFFCVSLFAMTAPFTRLAALAVTPETIILIRILGAAAVSLIFVLKDRWLPPRKAWPGLIATATGTVVGFNSLMAYGLREVPAGHAAVALAGLPMVTSVYSILRDRVNPGVRFWFFAFLGTALSIGFFFILNVSEILRGDLLLLLAVISASFGYVEGGRASRIYGGIRTMSWAILITIPICIPVAFVHFNQTADQLSTMSAGVWFSLAYVALVSQSLGMFLWFRVLAKGPMEQVALVQLLQPFVTLLGAIILLDESVLPVTWVIAVLVALCVFGANNEKKKIVKG